ncbi:histidine phosphatase family protein [Kiritimatiellota bacterium B12222]|nr:histidine phosphatase family protein [Kiritimatiellota bacterium B12222]
MIIHFIRHGEIDGDPHAHMHPPVSGCLSPTGTQQAAALCQALKDKPYTHIYASPLGRAIETAQPLAAHKNLPIQILPWLEEWRPAHILDNGDDTRYEEIMARAEALRPEQTWKTEAGESLMQMADRMIPGMLALLAQHGIEAGHGGYLFDDPNNSDHLAVFAHGGTLNLLLMFLLNLPLRPGNPFHFEKTGLAIIKFTPHADVWYPSLYLPPPNPSNPE